MGTGTAGAVEHSDEQGESFGRGEYAGWKCQRDRPCGRSQKVWSFRDAFPVEVQVRTYEESHRGGNAERGGPPRGTAGLVFAYAIWQFVALMLEYSAPAFVFESSRLLNVTNIPSLPEHSFPFSSSP